MPEWNKLPKELQEMVVQRSTKNTRTSLRICSRSCKTLVEGVFLKSLFYLGIDGTKGEWRIETKSSEFHSFLQSFANFDEFQQNLIKLLRTINCIERLSIILENSRSPTIKLRLTNGTNHGKRMLVESIDFSGTSEFQQENILLQMEPIYLRKITLHTGGESSRFFDLHQVVFAEQLRVYGPSLIREDQLLKLKAYDIDFDYVACSIHEYIKKCNLEAGTRLPRFKFGASSFSDLGLWNISTESPLIKVNLEIPDSQLKLEVTFEKVEEGTHRICVRGGVKYQSESCAWDFWRCCQSSFKTVDQLKIRFKKEDNNNSWNIVVRRQFCCQNEYKFQDFGEFRKKLDEIMDNLDFIKDFSIKLTGSKQEMRWNSRSDKPLMIKKLSVEGDNNITSVKRLLKQIDPNFLMDVTIMENADLVGNMSIHKMPQIRNASRVIIPNPYLQDSHLLEVENILFSVLGPNIEYGEGEICAFVTLLLTTTGVNQFIKKCLKTVDTRQINFNLGGLQHLRKTAKILEGLDVIEQFVVGNFTHWVINSDHPDYVMNMRKNPKHDVVIFVSNRGTLEPCNSF